MAETNHVFSRMVITCVGGERSEEFEAAFRSAKLLRAEIAGFFIEEENAWRAASLPMTRLLSSGHGEAREFTSAALERAQAIAFDKLQRQFEAAGKAFSVEWSIEKERGEPDRLLQAQIRKTDLIAVCGADAHPCAAVTFTDTRIRSAEVQSQAAVLHLARSGLAARGPIALLEDGDMITINAVTGELSVALSDEDLAARKAAWAGPKETIYASGALWKYARLVGSAKFGAVTHPGGKEERHVYMDL